MTFFFSDLIRYFKKIDIFGRSIELRFNNKKKHKTFLGASFTAIIICASFSYAIFLIIDLIFRQNPIVITYKELARDSQGISISEADFQIKIDLSDKLKQQPDLHRFLTIQAYYIKEQINNLGRVTWHEIIKLQTSFCNTGQTVTESTKSKIPLSQFDDNNNLICINDKQLDEIRLQGSGDENAFNYLYIEVRPCYNSTECYDSQKIKELLQYQPIIIHYRDQIVSVQNYDDPTLEINRKKTIKMNMDQENIIQMNIQQSNIFTDSGLILSDLQLIKTFQINDIQEESFHIQFFQEESLYDHLKSNCLHVYEYEPALAKIVVKESLFQQIYQRRYQKILTVFGILGGLIKSLVLIGFIIIRPITQLALDINLVNKIFDFEDGNEIVPTSRPDNLEIQKAGTPPSSSRRGDENQQNFISQSQVIQAQPKKFSQDSILKKKVIKSKTGMLFKSIDIQFNNPQNNLHKISSDYSLKDSQDGQSNRDILSPSLQTQRIVEQQDAGITLTPFKKQLTQQKGVCFQDIKNSNLSASFSPTKPHSMNKQKLLRERSKKSVLIGQILNQYALNNQMKVEDKMLQELKQIANTQGNRKYTFDNLLAKLFKAQKIIRLRLFDYIQYYLKCFRKYFQNRQKHIKFSVEKVLERLDIIYILNKLVEIDKMKVLLLDSDQIRLFEYLPKPIVQIDRTSITGRVEKMNEGDATEVWSFLHSVKTQTEKAGEAYKAFLNLSKKQQLSDLDKKLLNMIDQKMKLYFEKSEFNLIESNQIAPYSQTEEVKNPPPCNSESEESLTIPNEEIQRKVVKQMQFDKLTENQQLQEIQEEISNQLKAKE